MTLLSLFILLILSVSSVDACRIKEKLIRVSVGAGVQPLLLLARCQDDLSLKLTVASPHISRSGIDTEPSIVEIRQSNNDETKLRAAAEWDIASLPYGRGILLGTVQNGKLVLKKFALGAAQTRGTRPVVPLNADFELDVPVGSQALSIGSAREGFVVHVGADTVNVKTPLDGSAWFPTQEDIGEHVPCGLERELLLYDNTTAAENPSYLLTSNFTASAQLKPELTLHFADGSAALRLRDGPGDGYSCVVDVGLLAWYRDEDGVHVVRQRNAQRGQWLLLPSTAFGSDPANVFVALLGNQLFVHRREDDKWVQFQWNIGLPSGAHARPSEWPIASAALADASDVWSSQQLQIAPLFADLNGDGYDEMILFGTTIKAQIWIGPAFKARAPLPTELSGDVPEYTLSTLKVLRRLKGGDILYLTASCGYVGLHLVGSNWSRVGKCNTAVTPSTSTSDRATLRVVDNGFVVVNNGELRAFTAESNGTSEAALSGTDSTFKIDHPDAFGVADLDGDGYLDLYSWQANCGISIRFRVLSAGGVPKFVRRSDACDGAAVLTQSGAVHAAFAANRGLISSADIDGDGMSDFVVHSTCGLASLRSDGVGGVELLKTCALQGTSLVNKGVLVDMDGDRLADFAMPSENATCAGVQVFRGSGNGLFDAASYCVTAPSDTPMKTLSVASDTRLTYVPVRGASSAEVGTIPLHVGAQRYVPAHVGRRCQADGDCAGGQHCDVASSTCGAAIRCGQAASPAACSAARCAVNDARACIWQTGACTCADDDIQTPFTMCSRTLEGFAPTMLNVSHTDPARAVLLQPHVQHTAAFYAPISEVPSCAFNNGRDRTRMQWYAVRGTGAKFTINTCSSRLPLDTVISVFDCESLQCVGRNSNAPLCAERQSDLDAAQFDDDDEIPQLSLLDSENLDAGKSSTFLASETDRVDSSKFSEVTFQSVPGHVYQVAVFTDAPASIAALSALRVTLYACDEYRCGTYRSCAECADGALADRGLTARVHVEPEHTAAESVNGTGVRWMERRCIECSGHEEVSTPLVKRTDEPAVLRLAAGVELLFDVVELNLQVQYREPEDTRTSTSAAARTLGDNIGLVANAAQFGHCRVPVPESYSYQWHVSTSPKDKPVFDSITTERICGIDSRNGGGSAQQTQRKVTDQLCPAGFVTQQVSCGRDDAHSSQRVLTSSKSVVVRCPNGRLLGYDGVLRDAFNCSAKSDEPQGLGTRFCVDGCRSPETVPIELKANFASNKVVCRAEILPHLATIRAQLRVDGTIVANRTFTISKPISDVTYDDFVFVHTLQRLPDEILVEVEPAKGLVNGYSFPQGYEPFEPVSLATWSPETCDERPVALADYRGQLLDAVTNARPVEGAARTWRTDYPITNQLASLNRTWSSTTLLREKHLTRGVAVAVQVPRKASATNAFIPLAHLDESTLLARLVISKYTSEPKRGASSAPRDGEIAIEMFGEAIDGNPLTRVELSVVRDFRTVARFDVAFVKTLNVTVYVDGLEDAKAGREQELAAEYALMVRDSFSLYQVVPDHQQTDNITLYQSFATEETSIADVLAIFNNVYIFIGLGFAVLIVLTTIGCILERRHGREEGADSRVDDKSAWKSRYWIVIGVYVIVRVVAQLLLSITLVLLVFTSYNAASIATLEQFPEHLRSIERVNERTLTEADFALQDELRRQAFEMVREQDQCELYLSDVIRELANLQHDIQAYHIELMDERNMTGLRDTVNSNYLRNQTIAAEMAGATWMERYEAMEAYAENTFGEFKLYEQASQSNVAKFYAKNEECLNNMIEAAQNVTDQFLDYRRRMLVFIRAAEKIVDTYNRFRDKFIAFKEAVGKHLGRVAGAAQSVINKLNPFDDIDIDWSITAPDFFTLPSVDVSLPNLDLTPCTMEPPPSEWLPDTSTISPPNLEPVEKFILNLTDQPQQANEKAIFTHPQEFFAQHVTNRSTGEEGTENVSLRQVRRPNLGVDVWSWLPARAVFWGIVATLDILFMIVSYVKMTKTAIHIYAGVEDRHKYYLKSGNEKVGCCATLETRMSRFLWVFAKWMSCSNPTRLAMILQLVVILILGLGFFYVWLQLAAIVSNIISLRVMQELGLIDLLTSPVRLHLLVVNVRTLVSAETINNIHLPAFESMSQARIQSMMAQVSVFNNREAATLEKFNKEYCNTLKQLSIERCVPVSQRVAEPVLRPCQLQPVVPRLFARFDVYAYNERVRLSLLPYVNALRDIATSALYVPMFFFCIFALMVILKKVVILAFAQTSLVRTRHILEFHSSIDPRDHPDVYKREDEESIEQAEFNEYSKRDKRKTWREFNPLFGRRDNNNNLDQINEQYTNAPEIEMRTAVQRQDSVPAVDWPSAQSRANDAAAANIPAPITSEPLMQSPRENKSQPSFY